jgi:hypothetical protein
MLETRYQSGFDLVPGYWLLTCLNPDCPLHGHTFSHTNYPPPRLGVYFESGLKRLAAERAAQHPELDRLLPRQIAILVYLATALAIGRRPTIREIADLSNLPCTTVAEDLTTLRGMGLITHTPGCHRDYAFTEEF